MDEVNDNEMKFFYLDQRLLQALKDDDIEKYLQIVKEKHIEELNVKKQIIELKDEKIKEKEEQIKQKEKEEYIEMMLKKEEKLFEENRIEIQKKFEERVNERMYNEIKIMMMYKIGDSIVKLENTIKNALYMTNNDIKNTRDKIDTLFDIPHYLNVKYKTLKNDK
jgi:vacuolar-type H+-ATPase subunit I/STV1